MKNKIAIITVLLLGFVGLVSVSGQDATPTVQVEGVVLDAVSGKPIPYTQISSPDGVRSAITDSEGKFQIGVRNLFGELTVVRDSYHTGHIPLMRRTSVEIYLLQGSATMRPEFHNLPSGPESVQENYGRAVTVDKKNIGDAYLATSDALTGRIPGLRVLSKSGMPGEGSFLNLHGTRSLLGQNSPLVVIDGIPYLPDQKQSLIINGLSTDILSPVFLKDLESISFLQGSDALAYGSLGSNGVIMVETEKGVDNQILVEFQTVNGVSFIDKTLPLLGSLDFKKYISDIGSTRYQDLQDLETAFPFLKESLTDVKRVRYGYNTDWQKQIYAPAFSSDNFLKVKGGDAVVRFMLTAGYQRETGIEKGTSKDRFHTHGNTNINFSSKLTAYAAVSFDYTDLSLMEQGMVSQTNPMLAAYSHSPLTGKHVIDDNGNQTKAWAAIDPTMLVSNPAAMEDGINGGSKIFDMTVNTGIQYKLLDDLRLDVGFGIYYKYIKEDLFIGGKSDGSIAPLMDGLAENTVRGGARETKNYYGKVSGTYSRVFGRKHHLDATGG